jgi:hypothetical protein
MSSIGQSATAIVVVVVVALPKVFFFDQNEVPHQDVFKQEIGDRELEMKTPKILYS